MGKLATMRTRYYHLHSDHKTIKEITFEEWSGIIRRETSKTIHTKTVVRLSEHEIYIRQGRRSMWLDRRQIKAMLNAET